MHPLEGLVTGNTSVAHLMREHDWSQTRLGPPEKWPPALRTAAAICVESPALICVFWGPEFNFIYSDGWQQVLGERHPAAFGRPANEVFAATWDQLVSTSSQVSTTGDATSITLPHPDNQTVGNLQHSISPIRNEDGGVGGIFITSSNIAPAQAPIGQLDEASYRAVLTAAAAGVSEIDAQGVFTYVNDRYCELVGRGRDELLGRMTFQDVTYPEDTSSNPKLTHSHTAGTPFTVEKRYLQPDGTVVWVNLFANWIGNGTVEPVRCIAVSIDISERKRAEEAVRESEERKSFLLQLGDRLRPLSDPKAVMDTAAEMLGEHLGANRVCYGEVSPDGEVMTGRGHVNGVNSLPRRWHLGESAPVVLEHFRHNRTSVSMDMLTDPALTPEQRDEWHRAQVCAHVSVPLSKNGQLVAGLGVHQATPRQWTESEISLIEETAERTWAAVEQARAEAALRSSENRLAAIFTQAAVGLSELSLDGYFTQANDQLSKLLGRSREELLGMNILDVTHPDDIEHSKSIIAKLMEDGVPGSLDKRCLRGDGQVVFVSNSLSRLDDEHGRPRALLVVTVDLTERKRVEAVLAEELADNKRLQEISTRLIPTDEAQNLFDELLAATVGMSRADFGTLQLYDEQNHQLHLLAAHGIPEQHHKSGVVTAGHLTSCTTAMQERQRVIVENYATDPRYAGTKTAVEHLEAGITSATSTPLISRSGRMVGMISTHRRFSYTPDERQLRLLDIIARQAADLIERHQSEAALRTSEERYRTLFNSIDEGFCVIEVYFDDAGRALDYSFVEVNPVFTRQSGIVDPVGKRMREIAPRHEEHWFETYGKIALTGEPQRFVNRAESFGRWFDVYAFRFGESQSRRVAVLFTDITERVQAEENLKQADRRKNEFLAMLAHELRNPLAPIRTGLEVLRLSQGQAQTTERMLELMDRQMQQMVRLVDDLLDISRITQGKVQIRKQPCQLQNVLDNAIEASRPFIGDSGVKLTINILSEPVELDADPARLAQVFSNLLNNAAKYTDSGGQVWLTAEHHQQELVVKVRDTGTGIPANMLDAVFDAFTQVDNSLGRSHGGLGVGLSLVQSLVELHGGTVTAHSDGPGKGSEFVVRLPGLVSSSSSMDGEPPMPEDERLLSVSHRVLVVDDNMDAASALAMILEMLGHQVKVAHNGRDGLALAEEFQPQLLLLDLGMPELDGYDMARAVRAQRWGKSMVISALTGWGQAEDRQRSRAAGFDFHLVKPVEQEVLNDLLNSLSSDLSNGLSSDLSGESGSELCSQPSSEPQFNDCPDDG